MSTPNSKVCLVVLLANIHCQESNLYCLCCHCHDLAKRRCKNVKKDSGKTDVCVRRSRPRSTKKDIVGFACCEKDNVLKSLPGNLTFLEEKNRKPKFKFRYLTFFVKFPNSKNWEPNFSQTF